MRPEFVLIPLFCACTHRPPVVQHTAMGTVTPLLGTWRGALDSSPVTFRVYGSDEQGIHAELELSHPDGEEHWVLTAEPSNTDGLTFTTTTGLPSCSASISENRIVGECEVEVGGRKRQWLVVRQ